ncbi:hypothetical protein PIB30_075965 [Stylosanthes scabra]|uniref:F-box domain-containing protein n=1 Tax=Stylosanthes scabra TaxID=79078 RepID=A0ABU6VRA7_9FABA|nr:hypothetical protein [Stylosanthes scabra]
MGVKVLPEEVWVHIATMVVKESFQDLLSMKQDCKCFRFVAESDEVYKHSRLVKLPPFIYLCFIDKSERRLIKRCLKSGNPEAMFLKGHQQSLLWEKKKGKNAEDGGANLFNEVYALGDLQKYRQRIRRLLGRVCWVENRPSTPEQPASCKSTTCPTRGSMSERYREHQLNPHNKGDVDVSCDYCRADYGILIFFEMLSAEED